MTLIPHHCWRTASALPRTTTLNTDGDRISRFGPVFPGSLAKEDNSSKTAFAYAGPPSRFSTWNARSDRPLVASQRGLSGTKKVATRKRTDGTAVTANIHRHPH